MAIILKKLVEYEGISNQLPVFTEAVAPIKQVTVQETLELPEAKPDIEQLIKVKSELIIKSTRVISTPIGKSLESQNLTGWKLVIEAELRQKIRYVADEPTQRVHAAHFNVPFSTFIILPPDFDESKCVSVEGYIEDIYADFIGKRQIFKNTTLLFVAEIV